MNSRFRTEKPKKNYNGLYVTNLDEEFDVDLFTLDQPETVHKATNPNIKPLSSVNRTTSNPVHNVDQLNNSQIKENDPVRTKMDSTTNALNNSSLRQVSQSHRTDVKTKQNVSTYLQHVPVTSVSITKRPSAKERKLDIKGYSHDSEDLVLQNLDEDF